MSSTTSNYISTIAELLIYGMLVLVALSIFPFFENMYDTPKLLIIALFSIFGLLLWALKMIAQKTLSFTVHPFSLAFGLFALSFLVSAVFSPSSLQISLSSVMGGFFFLSLLGLVAPSVIRRFNQDTFLETILAVGALLTLASIAQLLNVGPSQVLSILFPGQFVDGFGFSFAGSPLSSMTLLIPMFIGGLASVIQKKKFSADMFKIVLLAVILVGLGVHTVKLFPGQSDAPLLLPFSAGWQIAVETFKYLRFSLVGFGPDGYSEAFTRFRPVDMNSHDAWSVIFQSSSNFPLTLLSSLGIFGLLSWMILLWNILRTGMKDAQHLPLKLMIGSIIVIHLLLPMNIALAALFFVSLIVWVGLLKDTMHENNLKEFRFTSHGDPHIQSTTGFVGAGIAILIGAWFLFLVGRNTIGEIFFNKASTALRNGNGGVAFDYQKSAIRFIPTKDLYHRTYAQTSFAIANAYASQEDVTEDQRRTATQLIQLSINQARIAAQLNPNRSINWKSMAEIYRSLIGVAEGADRFTVAAYVQAIMLSPSDPVMRVDLGRVLIQLQEYEKAQELLLQAVRLKPDYANAIYFWGVSLEKVEKYPLALQAYQRALELIQVEDDADAESIAQIEEDILRVQELISSAPTGDTTPGEQGVQGTPDEIVAEENPEIPDQPQEVENPKSDLETKELIESQPNIEASPSATP